MDNLIKESIKLIKDNEPSEGYHLAFSGGMDSQVLYHLTQEAEVKFQAYYQRDIAPPEVKQFIRSDYPQVTWESEPGFNFFIKMAEKGFPLRQARWCCEYMKERGGNGRTVLLGIRKEESRSRSEYPAVADWKKGHIEKVVVRPLLNWTRAEEKDYLRSRGIRWCSLYDIGFQRLGCVLCPMASKHEKRLEAAYWPKIALAWQHSFDRLWEHRIATHGEDWSRLWRSSKEMFWWYINEPKKVPKEQLRLVLKSIE